MGKCNYATKTDKQLFPLWGYHMTNMTKTSVKRGAKHPEIDEYGIMNHGTNVTQPKGTKSTIPGVI